LANVNFKLKTANGSPLKLLGNASVIIKIGDIEITHDCFVIDKLCSPALIGLDVMKKLKTIINFDNNSITFKQNKKREIFKINQKSDTQIIKLSNIKNPKKEYLESSIINHLNIIKNKTHDEQIIDKLLNQCEKGPQVPGDGDCGAHALVECFKELGYSLSTIDILKILGIQHCKTGYYLTDEDLAFICNTLNKNLIIIHEELDENKIKYSALIYWKSNRQPICIFHEPNHWRPGIFNKNNNKELRIQNSCICYEFPSRPTIKKLTLNSNFDYKKVLEFKNTKNNEFYLITSESQVEKSFDKLLKNQKIKLKDTLQNDDTFYDEYDKKNNKFHLKHNDQRSENNIINDDVNILKIMNDIESPEEFEKFVIKNLTQTQLPVVNNYEEIIGDIFSANYAIGHCVSRCLSMHKGIALEFRNRFQNIEGLKKQNKQITEVAHLKINGNWILYLITKLKYFNKPTWLNIFKTLKNTKKFCEINKIYTLALPKICSELDRKEWNIVSILIKIVFENSPTKIKIYQLPKKDLIVDGKNSNSKLFINPRINEESDIFNKTNFNKNSLCLPQYNVHIMKNDNDITLKCDDTFNSDRSNKNIGNIHKIMNKPYTHNNEIQFDINNELPINQQHQLKIILNKYSDCFAKNSTDLGSIDIGNVPIPTISDDPINLPPYRLSLKEQTELQRQVDELLKAGLIVPSNSSYASPAFLVNKTDGTKRLVIDYRQLNKQVPHQNFPITHIQTIFDCLEGAKFFNILDMQQGFLNILLGQTDRHKLAFITPSGLYEWTRFPFGYKNSPRQFSKAVAKALSGLLYLGTINYVDDVINYAKNFEDLLIILENLLNRIRETGFKLKASKCKFGYFELKILGQIVNKEGIKPNPAGLDAIKKFPTPKTIKQTRSFLGMCNFFRKFISRFAEIISPITNLTRGKFLSKKSVVNWTEVHQNAFEKLKEQLTNPPLLKHFNPDLPIIIWTDASKIGIAGTLLQKSEEDEQLHPVSFISRRLNNAEERYSAIELELLAIVYALETFRHYVYGVKIEIWTDHAPLRYLDNIKSLSVRIQRLKCKIIDFDFTIIYRKGLLNQVCDALSRNPVGDPPTIEQELQKDNDLAILHIQTVNLQIEQNNDPKLNKIIQALENPDISDHIWIRKSKNYFINSEKILMYKHGPKEKKMYLIAIPEKRINEILFNFHDHPQAGHLGVNKTYKKIIERYFWTTMYKDIRKYVTSCVSCQKRKADKTATYGQMLTSPKIIGIPFQRFTIDYIGPINPPSNGTSYILVGTCATTKYAIAKPYRTADAKSTVAFLLDIISQFGAIGEIHSDRGLHFANKLVKDLLKALNIKNTISIAYHPQSQGQAEKFNGTLIDMISHFVQEQPRKWSLYLKQVLFAYNTSVNDTTKFTPFYLLHGYHPKSIFDHNFISTDTSHEILLELEKLKNIRDELPKILEKRYLKNKKHYDTSKIHTTFELGERVLIKSENKTSKFAYRYNGPFKIIKQISDVTYVVEMVKNGQLVNEYKHISQLKKYNER